MDVAVDYKRIYGETKELGSGSCTKGVGFIGWASDPSWGTFKSDRGGKDRPSSPAQA